MFYVELLERFDSVLRFLALRQSFVAGIMRRNEVRCCVTDLLIVVCSGFYVSSCTALHDSVRVHCQTQVSNSCVIFQLLARCKCAVLGTCNVLYASCLLTGVI